MASIAPQKSQKPPVEALGIPVGTDQNLPFTMPYSDGHGFSGYEQFQDDSFIEDNGPSVKQLIAMRRTDGQARALYRLLTLPMRAALKESTFVAAKGDKGESEFITNVFTLPPESGGMTVTFSRFMSHLMMSLFDGFSAFEKIFWMPTFGPLSGKYTLQSLAYRPSETITFVTDKQGGFQGLRQRSYLNGEAYNVHIEKGNSFYYAAQEEERKFYGVSFFQSAFYHYDKKVKLYFTAHLAAQRAAVGTRVGTVPATATLQAKRDFSNNLSNLSFAQYMLMPEDFKVELLKDSGSFDFLNLINHHNSQMSKSILAAFFDASQGGGSGDASLIGIATPGDDTFMMMLQSIMDDIAASINHYIVPQLVDWNFSGGNYPQFTWGKLTDAQKETIAKTFNALAIAPQPNVTPEFMRQLEEHMADEMGLTVDYDEIDKEAAAAAAAQPQVDAQGNPLPSPTDALIDSFTQANSTGTTPPAAPPTAVPPAPGAPPAGGVSLSSDEENLLSLAQGLIDEATRVELSLAHVATTGGELKYKAPIGTQIVPKETIPTTPITMTHLVSLNHLLEAAKKSNDQELIKTVSSALDSALRRFAKGKKFSDVKKTLATLTGSSPT